MDEKAKKPDDWDDEEDGLLANQMVQLKPVKSLDAPILQEISRYIKISKDIPRYDHLSESKK